MSQHNKSDDNNDELKEVLQKLNDSLTKLNQVFRSPFKSMSLEFFYGMLRGLGFTIGMGILVSILGYILHLLIEIPVMGKFIANIVEVVTEELKKKQ